MKLKLLFFVLFFISHGFVFSQTIYRQDLNHLASIDFPDTVKASTTSGLPTFKATKKSNIYLVLAYDVSDSTTIVKTQEDLDNFYAGVVEGTTSKTIKIKYKKNILIEGLKGLEFEYLNSVSPEKSNFVYERVVYFNKNAFVYMFITYDETQKNNQVERNKFFNSFHITIPKKNIEQFAVLSNLAYGFGYLAGKIVGYLLIIGFIVLLGFGIVYIIKKTMNK